jgi:uncharacterized protein (TIGR00255 family)
MIKSMTAYGRCSGDSPLGPCVVEIHSVNRKFLDINVMMPRECLCLDVDLRRWIGEVAQRGQITVRVHFKDSAGPVIATPRLKELQEGWTEAARALGYDPAEVVDLAFLVERLESAASASSLMPQPDVQKCLKEMVHGALAEWDAMREREGAALLRDMEARVGILEGACKQVELLAVKSRGLYERQLYDKILTSGGKESAEKLWEEVVRYAAEKLDITEELTRLRSHIGQLRHYLAESGKSVGRTLDFLIQEMNREVNTLSVKSADAEISLAAVAMKSELERIREQVQNIE